MSEGFNPGLGLAILRVVLGVIFIAHGVPKLTGGIDVTAVTLGGAGIPAPLLAAWSVALLELVGGLLLIVGLWVTPVALLLAARMLLGLFLIQLPHGFYVVEGGSEGIEFNLVVVAGLLVLVLVGSGHATLRGLLQRDIEVA